MRNLRRRISPLGIEDEFRDDKQDCEIGSEFLC
jgi:hypothetical protein